MGQETLKSKIKHWVFVIVCPIYLWSIGYKTLNEYLYDIESQFEENGYQH